MSATFLTVLLLLAYNSALLAASVATESISVGPPPPWRQGRHRRCRTKGHWLSRAPQIRSAFPRL